MEDRRADQERRQLVLLVTQFAAMPTPLDSGAVLAHFAEHPWFTLSNAGSVILGTTGATVPLGTAPIGDAVGASAFAVSSYTPLASVPVAVAPFTDTTSFTPTAITIVGDRPTWLPKEPELAPSAFIAGSAFEADQRAVRDALGYLKNGTREQRQSVGLWVRAHWMAHPDLVRGYYDWETARPRVWLATVWGACVLSLHFLLLKPSSVPISASAPPARIRGSRRGGGGPPRHVRVAAPAGDGSARLGQRRAWQLESGPAPQRDPPDSYEACHHAYRRMTAVGGNGPASRHISRAALTAAITR